LTRTVEGLALAVGVVKKQHASIFAKLQLMHFGSSHRRALAAQSACRVDGARGE
jgi:hypothetical protein